MPRGVYSRRRRIIKPASEETDTLSARKLDKKEILRDAKAAGLFRENKYTKTYEIVITKREYSEL